MSLATPLYNLGSFPNVYDPSEDSFLLLDALEMELDFLKVLTPKFVVEIGSGSGIIVTSLAQFLGSTSFCFATDINSEACFATIETAKLNKANVESLNMNLLDSFRNAFDVILFNPPYVVTTDSEMIGTGLNRAWAGGFNGRKIIDKLLLSLPFLMSSAGVCYLLLLKENNPDEIVKSVSSKNITGEKISERRIRGEHLFVYKFRFKV